MGWTVLKQPDGKFAIYTSVSDGIISFDLDEDEVKVEFIEAAISSAMRNAQQSLGVAKGEIPRRPYIKWDEAVKAHNQTFPKLAIDPVTCKPINKQEWSP